MLAKIRRRCISLIATLVVTTALGGCLMLPPDAAPNSVAPAPPTSAPLDPMTESVAVIEGLWTVYSGMVTGDLPIEAATLEPWTTSTFARNAAMSLAADQDPTVEVSGMFVVTNPTPLPESDDETVVMSIELDSSSMVYTEADGTQTPRLEPCQIWTMFVAQEEPGGPLQIAEAQLVGGVDNGCR